MPCRRVRFPSAAAPARLPASPAPSRCRAWPLPKDDSLPDAPTPTTAEFIRLLEPLLAAAHRTALHLTHNPSDADDLVQEASYHAFRAFHTYRPGTRFAAWFFTILTHAFYGEYRKRRRRPDTRDIDDVPPLYLYERASETGLLGSDADPAAAILERLDVAHIVRALGELPEEFRVVASLFFVEDLSYEDIARMLECPVGTVRSRLHRARRLLQKSLWDVAVEAGIVPSAPIPTADPGAPAGHQE